jgi:carbon monoxide dehydrogenase subunit G
MANTTFTGPVRSLNGFQSVTKNATTGAVTVNASFGAATSVTDLTTTNLVFTDQNHPTTAAINATGVATAAQVITGYITSTSASPTTITLPTGTLLGAALGAVRGTVMDLYVDNTAGASTVTIAVATNGILSSAAADTPGSFGDLTIPAGATGLARFTIMFSSATAYVFTRTA